MDDTETHATEQYPAAGYMRCADCGRLILASFGYQTGRRCLECWKDRSPLATLEVINDSIRYSATTFARNKPQRRHPNTEPGKTALAARGAALTRLAHLFPDVYAMILDEERVQRGLPPRVHYEPIDFEQVASKTLAFDSVYDALESRGVTDA